MASSLPAPCGAHLTPRRRRCSLVWAGKPATFRKPDSHPARLALRQGRRQRPPQPARLQRLQPPRRPLPPPWAWRQQPPAAASAWQRPPPEHPLCPSTAPRTWNGRGAPGRRPARSMRAPTGPLHARNTHPRCMPAPPITDNFFLNSWLVAAPKGRTWSSAICAAVQLSAAITRAIRSAGRLSRVAAAGEAGSKRARKLHAQAALPPAETLPARVGLRISRVPQAAVHGVTYVGVYTYPPTHTDPPTWRAHSCSAHASGWPPPPGAGSAAARPWRDRAPALPLPQAQKGRTKRRRGCL